VKRLLAQFERPDGVRVAQASIQECTSSTPADPFAPLAVCALMYSAAGQGPLMSLEQRCLPISIRVEMGLTIRPVVIDHHRRPVAFRRDLDMHQQVKDLDVTQSRDCIGHASQESRDVSPPIWSSVAIRRF
jgi:hypothetical protein